MAIDPQGITGLNYVQITAGTTSLQLLKDTVPRKNVPRIRSESSALSDLLDGGGNVLARADLLEFLRRKGYVNAKDELTEDGQWASQLRVDQPLLIAEGFRAGVFPRSDPALLAAIVAVFVNEKETDERLDRKRLPKDEVTAYLRSQAGILYDENAVQRFFEING